MDRQRLGVADIGQMRNQFQCLDEFAAGLGSAFDPEPDDRTGLPAEIFVGQGLIRASRQSGVIHPIDPVVSREELGDLLRVLAVARHPQVQRFQPLQKEERVKR